MERSFIPVSISLLTISDTRCKEDDKSGDLLENKVIESGHILYDRKIVKDEIFEIQEISNNWINNSEVEIIISTGGTGLTGRDVSPEAFREIFDKEIEGFGELFRYLSFKKIGTSSLQSRAIAGLTDGTFIFALPGSTGACRDAWDGILKYQLDSRTRPCNLVDLLPRLKEI